MAALFYYKKQELFDWLISETAVLADSLDNPKIQLSEPHYGLVKSYFCMAGKKVLQKIGAHTEGIQVPYVQTQEGENYPEAEAINFTLVTPEGTRDGVNVPMINASIKEFILYFVLQKWLKNHGHPDYVNLEELASEIKKAVEYGCTLNRKYRAFG